MPSPGARPRSACNASVTCAARVYVFRAARFPPQLAAALGTVCSGLASPFTAVCREFPLGITLAEGLSMKFTNNPRLLITTLVLSSFGVFGAGCSSDTGEEADPHQQPSQQCP